MKGFVNRRKKGYHVKRLEDLTNLDIIASTILAFNWSRRHCDTFSSQSLIQLDCVACCYVQKKTGQTDSLELWVASNSQTITNDDIEALRFDIGDNIPIYIVYNGKPFEMHAEMQLLVEIINSEYVTNYMGVSKPCCEHCRSVLEKYQIGYTHWHQSSVKNWQDPFSNGAYINN